VQFEKTVVGKEIVAEFEFPRGPPLHARIARSTSYAAEMLSKPRSEKVLNENGRARDNDER
jgi:hypothetical protein